MKNKFVKGLTFGCLTCVLFACNEKTEAPIVEAPLIDKEAIKKEIQAKEDSFAAVYNSGEIKNIGYYGDDATSYYQNREPLVGKEAIIEFLKSSKPLQGQKITFTTREVLVGSDGNLVVELGSFKIVDSADSPLNVGNYMSVFEKRNGRYVSIRDMSTSDASNK